MTNEVIAVSCVLESSLALAAEWPQILADYFAPLLHRLGETHNSPPFRMSFVSYAMADTRPTPILSKIFFSPPQTMTKTMREQPQELGIGQTASGGGHGMAALEGLVAALEMFDMLKSSVEKADTVVTCHLIHVACTPPDPAERPMWNVSPALDSITWDTLPTELRKRGVHYSNILLRPITRFSDLQASAGAGAAQTPWFTVRSPHAVHITGFPQKGTKRAGNTAPAPERSPEIAKRPKVKSESPQKSPAIPPGVPPAGPPSSSPPSVPPPGNGSVPSNFLLDPTQRAEWQTRMRVAEMNLRVQMAKATELEKAGDLEEAKRQKMDVTLKADRLMQLKAAMANAQAQAQAPSQSAGPSSAGPPSQTQPTSAPPATAKPAEALLASTATDLAAKIEPSRSRVPKPSTAAGAQSAAAKPADKPPPTQISSEMEAQIKKLVEQKNKPSQLQLQPPQPPAPTSVPVEVPPPPPIAPPAKNLGQWQGTFTWRGFDSETHVRKDVQTRIIVESNQPAVMRPETWPGALSLAPSQHRAVPTEVLVQWLLRQKCIQVNIQPHPHVPDPKANDEHFRGLIRLLTEKTVYALAAWPGQNSVTENRLLIFPRQNGLAGAYFPMPGGVPELPKEQPPPQPQSQSQPQPQPQQPPPQPPNMAAFASLLAQMTPEQRTAFHGLTPERKATVMKSLFTRFKQQVSQQQQISQQQQQQQLQQLQRAQTQGQMTNLNPQQPPQQQQRPQLQPQGMNPWMQGGTPNVATMLGQFMNQPQNQGSSSNPTPQPQPPHPVPGANPMANMGMNMGMNVNMGMNFGMGQMPQPQQQQQQQPQQGMPPGMHRRTPSGNAQGGVQGLSYEMLQSFMQRNQEGGGGGANGSLGGMA